MIVSQISLLNKMKNTVEKEPIPLCILPTLKLMYANTGTLNL